MISRRIYSRRFAANRAYRDALWGVLCRDFFQKMIPREGSLLEIGAGYCEYINHMEAAQRTALDINPDLKKFAAPGVRTVVGDLAAMRKMKAASFDAVFASNLFEHLERGKILETIRAVFRILKPGGQFIILQPNIRFSARDYWMFFDHITPIDDRALAEALEINGFAVRRIVERFLPHSTKSRFPKSLWLIRAYLRLPFTWRLFGRQSLIVAGKDAEA